jgi:hypothetical protein
MSAFRQGAVAFQNNFKVLQGGYFPLNLLLDPSTERIDISPKNAVILRRKRNNGYGLEYAFSSSPLHARQQQVIQLIMHLLTATSGSSLQHPQDLNQPHTNAKKIPPLWQFPEIQHPARLS